MAVCHMGSFRLWEDSPCHLSLRIFTVSFASSDFKVLPATEFGCPDLHPTVAATLALLAVKCCNLIRPNTSVCGKGDSLLYHHVNK